MIRNRTLALLTLLLLILVACILLRATALTPSDTSAIQTGDMETLDESSEVPVAPVQTQEETVTPEPTPPKPLEVVTPVTVIPQGCYVGGCSSQICSDNPDMVSTCEWRESYACYQTATCERQQSGECGWTETPALSACLMQANSNTTLTF